jgi:hypothetical protein
VHAHLGWVGGLGSGGEVVGMVVPRRPAAAAATARGSGEERRTDNNARPWEVLRVLGERVRRSAGGGSERRGKFTGGGSGGLLARWCAERERAAVNRASSAWG